MKGEEGKKTAAETLREKLKPYCKHFSDCAIWRGEGCTCGLYELLGVK